MLKSLTIHGLRGFGEQCKIEFAIPNNSFGSGMTILVGANNSGKTTILEALPSFNSRKDESPSFSERKRNIQCENGKIHLCLQTVDDELYKIPSLTPKKPQSQSISRITALFLSREKRNAA